MKRHDLLPTEFISAGTLQMSQTIAYTMGEGNSRFKRQTYGSDFANSFAIPSSFRKETHQVQKEPLFDQCQSGRPLFQQELRKENPASTDYDLEGTFGSQRLIDRSRAVPFMHSHDAYRKTCDIDKQIKVFHHANDVGQAGVASYDIATGIKAIKKRAPIFSQGRAKQFTLWDQGIGKRFANSKASDSVPGPGAYNKVEPSQPMTHHYPSKYPSQLSGPLAISGDFMTQQSPKRITQRNFASSTNHNLGGTLNQDLAATMIMFLKHSQPPMAMGKALLHTSRKSPASHRPSRQAFADMTSTNHSFKVPVKYLKIGRNNSSGTYNAISKNEIETITHDSLMVTPLEQLSAKVEISSKRKRRFAPKQHSQDTPLEVTQEQRKYACLDACNWELKSKRGVFGRADNNLFDVSGRMMRSVQDGQSPVAAVQKSGAPLASESDISTALYTNTSKQAIGLKHAKSLYSEYPGERTSKRPVLHHSLRQGSTTLSSTESGSRRKRVRLHSNQVSHLNFI